MNGQKVKKIIVNCKLKLFFNSVKFVDVVQYFFVPTSWHIKYPLFSSVLLHSNPKFPSIFMKLTRIAILSE